MPDESDICMADLVMHPGDVKEATVASRMRNTNVAVLINLPEHLCINIGEDTDDRVQDSLIGKRLKFCLRILFGLGQDLTPRH